MAAAELSKFASLSCSSRKLLLQNPSLASLQIDNSFARRRVWQSVARSDLLLNDQGKVKAGALSSLVRLLPRSRIKHLALGFDGDGDRCGVVDNEGEEIFADKVGVMLARDLSALHPDAQFVADVKSTGLFKTDPVLIKNGAKTDRCGPKS